MPRNLSIIKKFQNERKRIAMKRNRTLHAVQKQQSSTKNKKTAQGRNAWSRIRGHVRRGSVDLYGMKMKKDHQRAPSETRDEQIESLYRGMDDFDVPMKELSYYAGSYFSLSVLQLYREQNATTKMS